MTGLGFGQPVDYDGLEALELRLGSGADLVTVSGTHAGTTSIDTGAAIRTSPATATSSGRPAPTPA